MTIEPRDGAFDDPSFGHDLETDCGVGTLDDLNVEMRKNFCQCGVEFRSLISAIGEERLQERKHPKQCCRNQNAPVAILDIGRMDDGDKRTVVMREVVNGLMYVLSTGCQWRAIPKDLPPKSTVHDYFDLWTYDG